MFVAFETNAEFLLVYFASPVRFHRVLLLNIFLAILVIVIADKVAAVIPVLSRCVCDFEFLIGT